MQDVFSVWMWMWNILNVRLLIEKVKGPGRGGHQNPSSGLETQKQRTVATSVKLSQFKRQKLRTKRQRKKNHYTNVCHSHRRWDADLIPRYNRRNLRLDHGHLVHSLSNTRKLTLIRGSQMINRVAKLDIGLPDGDQKSEPTKGKKRTLPYCH